MRITAVGLVAACAIAAGCGGGPEKRQPTQRDVAVIGASVADVVYQCQSAAAGFVAEPDREALERDVDRLVSVGAHVEADAQFRIGRAPRTTLRRQVQLAARNLRADCSPAQAARLDDGVD